MIDAEARLIEAASDAVRPAPTEGRFTPGARVFHQKFGYGTVAQVDAGKLDIDFDKAGRKKIVDSFVEPA
ncbi:MAG: hypothetical protein ACE5JZ_08610 [Kiloniellales bacterium]